MLKRIVSLQRVIVAMSLAGLGASCAGEPGVSPTSPSPNPTPAPTATSFLGTVAGRGEHGTLEVTIQARVAGTAESLTRQPQVAADTSATLQLGGASGPMSLTGTYEESTGDLSMSGGGFSFNGRVAPSGQELLGTYSGPGGPGRYSALNSADTVATYCGTFAGTAAGRLSVSISTAGAISGSWVDTTDGSGGALGGHRSGNDLSLTSDPPVGFVGTQSGSSLSGTWGDGSDGGAWNANTAGCQQMLTVPSVRFPLTVVTAGGGEGVVTSRPVGIACGNGQTNCMRDYPRGRVVTLTPEAAMGSSFAGWSGHADCSDGKVTMSNARSCTARFTAVVRPATFTLTVSTAGDGQGTITSSPTGISCGNDCDARFDSGTLVSLRANAVGGSMFTGWAGDSDCSNGIVTMSADRNCIATFARTPQVTGFYGTYSVSLDLTKDTCGDITYATSATISLSGSSDGSNLTVVVTSESGAPAGNEPRTYRGAIDTQGQFSASGDGGTPFALPRGALHGFSGQIAGVANGNSISGEEILNYMIGCAGQVRFDFSGSR